MKTLRTIFPYGLNQRAPKKNESASIGSLFPPIPRTTPRQPMERNHSNNNSIDVNSLENFFDILNNVLLTQKKDAWNILRVLLNKCKKSY